MHYGIYLPNFGPFGDARALAELARDAENAGWDGFFIWDHIAGWGALPIVDPWVGLAAVALATQRIRIGTLVTPIPRRRPWKLARETVSLDRLSNGRLILGVGIGLGEDEWDNLGEEADLKARGAMLDEGLDVLTGLWSGEPFSYEGKYYHVKKTRFLPTPVQQPRIPIWVGGFWPNKAPARRAARWDGAFILYNAEGDEELAQVREHTAYLKAQRAGRAGPFDIIYAGRPTPANNRAEAAEIVAGYRAIGEFTWWLENISPYAFGQDPVKDSWPVEALRERVLAGPPK
jgi:alkanesulfonate monooxygenase SsuD/methylene tetrahydromethanopterin reductase-like flavin-dependent oxidoreductase (luciferase family)